MLGTFVGFYKFLLNTLFLFSNQLSDFSPPLLPWGAMTPGTPAGYESDPSVRPLGQTRNGFKFEINGDEGMNEEVDPSQVKVSENSSRQVLCY
jgi:hypothetical protein